MLPDRLLHVPEGSDRLVIYAEQAIAAVDTRQCELTALTGRPYLQPGLAVQLGLSLVPCLMGPKADGGGAAAGPDAAHGANASALESLSVQLFNDGAWQQVS